MRAAARDLGLTAPPIVRAELQRVIRETSEARAMSGSAHALFERLLGGRSHVVDWFEADDRRYLVALDNPVELVSTLSLAPRERQVARLAATGRAVKTIAFDLALTPNTAAGYLLAAYRKTGLRTRTELIHWFSRCV